jgi:cytochrome c-type biogenesis protein CcmE
MNSKTRKKRLVKFFSMQLLVKITFLIAILGDLGSAKKFRMSTEIYKEVEENGQRYKVYEPLNDNE